MQGYVSAINVAPLKSGRAISVTRAEVNERGLGHDRELMVVDASGKFLSQRDVPRLALVTSQLDYDTGCVWFSAPDMPDIQVPLSLMGRIHSFLWVTVHKDSCSALYFDWQASQWFSEFLHMQVKLVRVNPANPRRHYSNALGREFPANFQDGSHAMIVSCASMDDFNSRVAQPIPGNRWRSTLEVSGVSAYEEDTWKHIRIGNVEMLGANLNVRCQITTTDQETGLRDPNQEPLWTLATYRETPEGLVFGKNYYVIKGGFINAGDAVEILE